MGSATIKTNLGAGQYIVELTKSQAAIVSQKTSLTTRKTEIDSSIAAKEIELAALNVTMNEKYEALKTAVGDYAVADPPTKALRKAVTDAQKAYITAQSNVTKKQTEINLINLELVSVNKRLEEIETALTVETRTVWCADYSINLSGSVGTLEVNGEAGQIIIMPGGATGAGLLQHPLAMTPAGVFYNWALLPCWQKWKPTYRVGIITAVDKAGGKVDVGIPDQYSEGLMINQGGESWDYSYTEEAVTAWEDFATRNPNFALVTNESDSEISNTSQLQKDLDTVNKRVNGSCWQVKDEFEYGRDDYWTIMEDGACGDCEDFALTKAKHLLDLGYPASALHIEIGYTGNGTGHAWLVVQTDKGDYILDNLYQLVMDSGDVPYSDRMRQTGMEWKIQGVNLKDVTADYMGTGALVFEEADRVVVQFQSQSWNNPKVIGFETNPKECINYVGIKYYRTDGKHYFERLTLLNSDLEFEYKVIDSFEKSTAAWVSTYIQGWSHTFSAYLCICDYGYNESLVIVKPDGTILSDTVIYYGNYTSTWEKCLCKDSMLYLRFGVNARPYGDYICQTNGTSLTVNATVNPFDGQIAYEESGMTILSDLRRLWWYHGDNFYRKTVFVYMTAPSISPVTPETLIKEIEMEMPPWVAHYGGLQGGVGVGVHVSIKSLIECGNGLAYSYDVNYEELVLDEESGGYLPMQWFFASIRYCSSKENPASYTTVWSHDASEYHGVDRLVYLNFSGKIAAVINTSGSPYIIVVDKNGTLLGSKTLDDVYVASQFTDLQ